MPRREIEARGETETWKRKEEFAPVRDLGVGEVEARIWTWTEEKETRKRKGQEFEPVGDGDEQKKEISICTGDRKRRDFEPVREKEKTARVGERERDFALVRERERDETFYQCEKETTRAAFEL